MTLRLVCVVRIFVFRQQNMRKLDVLRGGFMCEFAPTIKWHRIALWRAHFGLHFLQNNKMGVFSKLV